MPCTYVCTHWPKRSCIRLYCMHCKRRLTDARSEIRRKVTVLWTVRQIYGTRVWNISRNIRVIYRNSRSTEVADDVRSCTETVRVINGDDFRLQVKDKLITIVGSCEHGKNCARSMTTRQQQWSSSKHPVSFAPGPYKRREWKRFAHYDKHIKTYRFRFEKI